MKYARVQYANKIYSVTVSENEQIHLPDGQTLTDNDVIWLPPSNGTMFALGLNYADHASELAFTPPTEPLVFVKTPSTYTGHKQKTWRPDNVEYMHYEAELVAVIGKPAKNVKKQNAFDYIAGYTLCNDYAVRDYLENYYRPNLRVKNRDSATPLGPYIVDVKSVPDPMNLTLKTWVNDTLHQVGHTADMIFDIPYLVEYLSGFMTLQPGDMIATGTPKGLSDVQPSDEVKVEIEGIGSLINYVVSETEFFNP